MVRALTGTEVLMRRVVMPGTMIAADEAAPMS